MAKDSYIQALRGLAIAAVVLIHCLPECESSIILRPLLNWSVAMFLFLSGMLTTEKKVRGGVVRKRIRKALLPYLIWSFAYILVFRPDGIKEAVWELVTGGAAAQMYFLLVYAQLVVLTPGLFSLLGRYRVMLYALTPCTLAFREIFAMLRVDVPIIGALFPTWLIYYLFGLEWAQWRDFLKRHCGVAVATALVALAAQCAEGFIWLEFGDYNMATTQLRLTNMVSSLAIIAMLMLMPEDARSLFRSCRQLVCLGDVSFGVYLCHVAVLAVMRKLFLTFGLVGFFPSLILWASVLAVSVMAIALCRRTLPKRILPALGFE